MPAPILSNPFERLAALLDDRRLRHVDRDQLIDAVELGEHVLCYWPPVFDEAPSSRCTVCLSDYRFEIEHITHVNPVLYGRASARGLLGQLPPGSQVTGRTVLSHVAHYHDPMFHHLRRSLGIANLRRSAVPGVSS